MPFISKKDLPPPPPPPTPSPTPKPLCVDYPHKTSMSSSLLRIMRRYVVPHASVIVSGEGGDGNWTAVDGRERDIRVDEIYEGLRKGTVSRVDKERWMSSPAEVK